MPDFPVPGHILCACKSTLGGVPHYACGYVDLTS